MDKDLLEQIVNLCVRELQLDKAAVTKFLTQKSTRQGTAFWQHRAEFVLLLQGFDQAVRRSRFFDLINFLGTQLPGQGPDLEMARANWLLRFNRVFRCKWVNIKSYCRGTDNPSLVVQLLTEIVDARVHEEPAFNVYRQKFKDVTFFNLYDMREKWVAQGRPVGGLYLLISTLHRQQPKLLTSLSAGTCIDLQQLIHVHPPRCKFKGFGRWGCGDAEDKRVATNIRNHFKKHVLNAGKKSLEWLDECSVWWGLLDIKLDRSRLDRVPDGPKKEGALRCFDGQPVLPAAGIDEFLVQMNEELKRQNSPLLEWLLGTYAIRYRDRTLAMATRLSKAAVFLERGAVYVSGACDQFYVVGRIDDNVLTISSCYVVRDIQAKLLSRGPPDPPDAVDAPDAHGRAGPAEEPSSKLLWEFA